MRRMLARWQYVEVRLAVVCALLSGLFRPASESSFEIDAYVSIMIDDPRALSRVRRIPVLSFPPETILVTYSEPPNLKTSRSQRTRRLFALRLPKDSPKSKSALPRRGISSEHCNSCGVEVTSTLSSRRSLLNR